MVFLFLIFWEISVLFSIVAAPIYIPANTAQGLLFSQDIVFNLIFVKTCR